MGPRTGAVDWGKGFMHLFLGASLGVLEQCCDPSWPIYVSDVAVFTVEELLAAVLSTPYAINAGMYRLNDFMRWVSQKLLTIA